MVTPIGRDAREAGDGHTSPSPGLSSAQRRLLSVLEELASQGEDVTLTRAARIAFVPVSSAHSWVARDPAFAAAVRKASRR